MLSSVRCGSRGVLVVVAIGLAISGCGSESTEAPAPERQTPVPPRADSARDVEPVPDEVEELVEVPEVVGLEGQEAVDAIGAEGLTASHDEPDPAGCEVEDQDQMGEVEPGTEVVLTLDCRQRDWEARDGLDWLDFAAEFVNGAREGCDALFSLSPDGVLYADEDEYTVTDCRLAYEEDPESAGVEVPLEVPDDPAALGWSLGFDHGCEALFERELISVLSYGTDSFTAEDCVSAGE